MWVVTVAAHRVEPRWDVPARCVRIGGASERHVRLLVLSWAQSDAGVPPWKPCLREGWPFVSAVREEVEL